MASKGVYKPFKPLTLKAPARPAYEPEEVVILDSPPAKRRRLNEPEEVMILDSPPPPPKRRRHLIHDNDDGPLIPAAPAFSSAAQAPRKPLLPVRNPVAYNEANAPNTEEGQEGYYRVLWRKFTAKKHKTWDGDGILSVYGGYAHLQNEDGQDMGKKPFRELLLPGNTLSIGGKDVEIDAMMSKAEFLSGRPFLNTSTPLPKPAAVEPFVKPKKLTAADKKRLTKQNDLMVAPKTFYKPSPISASASAKFKKVVATDPNIMVSKDGTAAPRHDPNAPGAVVMKRPNEACPAGKQLVDVVIDPTLTKQLRDHQKEGIQFLYECVTGIRPFNGQGAILADEMGLGKTLQTIGLLWTLLKQKPFMGERDVALAGSGKMYEGVVKKALIVCPATLLENWRKEFHKWLTKEKISVFVADGPNPKIRDFMHSKSQSVMIIGYEKLRSVQDELSKGDGIDIVIADEGHRLKTAKNKSAQAIRNLNTPRRVILSGTPIQNDLSEFFVMIDFVNPGLLGNYKTFQKEFEAPIMKSRQTNATAKDIEKGAARGEELASLTKMFILRRTGEIQANFLPPKSEFVLFCKPTAAQAEVYQHILESPVFGSVLGSPEASLQLITILKKVCNSPTLLLQENGTAPANKNVAELLASIPAALLQSSPVSASCKFRVLDRLLRTISKTTSEKVVLVSNYTSTLDLIGKHLVTLGLPFLRLDGSTPSARRQDLVDAFNKTAANRNFAFLLSAKSGGVGINLIGASRLVLFDVDWNPSTDLQAMARIHRQGQQRPVKIYRMLMAGGMDEKIYQRQVTKMGLADSVVDGKKNESSFSQEELRDLFRLNLNAACQTHDLLFCECKGLGAEEKEHAPPPASKPSRKSYIIGDSDDEEDEDDKDLPELAKLKPIPRPRARLVPASEYQVEEHDQMDTAARKRKTNMQALMSYLHIDMSVFAGEQMDVFDEDLEMVVKAKKMLHDDVLVKVLQEDKSKVGFVFVKSSGARSDGIC